MSDKFWHHVYIVVNSFIEIVEGLVKIMTFGFVIPIWSLEYTIWDAKKRLKRKASKKKNQ